MNKRKLNKVFAEIKEKANMDYAITNSDEYGDCNTCVNSLSLHLNLEWIPKVYMQNIGLEE